LLTTDDTSVSDDASNRTVSRHVERQTRQVPFTGPAVGNNNVFPFFFPFATVTIVNE
jgi:hypothetical protein